MSRNEDEAKIGPAIGIDLGTWKCCVGVLRDGKVEIIENERGSKTTPSYVAFTDTERIIGEDAKSQVALNPTNTVYGVKRIIGRRFDDPSLEVVKKTFPFTVGQEDGKPRIEIAYKKGRMSLCPEQVSAMLLTKMKRIAESHLGCEVKDAVISVPAYFNNAQRQATMDAGAIAGLNVLGLINEPTAAALAYRDNKGPSDETICLVDLGGGTVDVSIIRMEGEKGVTVVETSGDTALGGMDFDQRLVEHFKNEFEKQTNQDISGSKALERLRLACQKLKHTLSLLPTARIQLDCLAMDTDLESSIARENFEILCEKEFKESLYSVLTRALRGFNLGSEMQHTDKFDRVVLVGGSTRIPCVQELLKQVFNKGLDKSVNPDEAVAHGAAIKAALLGKEPSVQDVVVRDVTPHTIVIESNRGDHGIVFQLNCHDRQNGFEVRETSGINYEYNLYECLSDVQNNMEVSRRLLGSMKWSDLPEPVTLYLNFSINGSGILCGHTVFAKRWSELSFDSNCLNRSQQLSMEEQENFFQIDEENEKRRLESLSNLEAFCFSKKPLVEELSCDDNSDSEIEKLKQKFVELCEEIIDWLDCTPEATKDKCETKKNELEDLFNSLISPSPEIETSEMNGDTKQPQNTVDQRAGANPSSNHSENASCQNSEGVVRMDGLPDPLQNDPSARNRNWQQTPQSRGDLSEGLLQMNMKKKIDDQTKFGAGIASMYNTNIPHQSSHVHHQEPDTGPWRYDNSSPGMPFTVNHFSVPAGSGVPSGSGLHRRTGQTSGTPAEVHKPGRSSASGAMLANAGDNGRPHSSTTPQASKYGHFDPEKGQGLHTHKRSLERQHKPSESRYQMDSDKKIAAKKVSDNFFIKGCKKVKSTISDIWRW